MKLIYVCSPYRGDTKADVQRNVRRARAYCRLVCQRGGIPFAPHLLFTQFLNDCNPRQRRLGMEMGIQMLDLCDELWVFGAPSEGMASEILHAMKLEKPIRWFDAKGRAGSHE